MAGQIECVGIASRVVTAASGDYEDRFSMATLATQNEFNIYESADARFESAARKLGLEEGLYRFLKYPNKEITVYIPVILDNGHLEVFIGYRVHHSIVRGPGKGGIRFAPTVTLDEVR